MDSLYDEQPNCIPQEDFSFIKAIKNAQRLWKCQRWLPTADRLTVGNTAMGLNMLCVISGDDGILERQRPCYYYLNIRNEVDII